MTTPLAPLFRLAASVPPRLTILIFHSVLPGPDGLRPTTPDARAFAAQLDWLGSVYDILPLGEAINRLREHRLPRRAAAITFDDGYADNLEVATPILRAKGMPATFFLTTAWLDGGLMFNDAILETVRRWPGASLNWPEAGVGTLALGTDAERFAAAETLINAWKHLPFAERAQRVQAFSAEVSGLPRRLMLDAEGVRGLHRAGMTIGGHTHSHPILATLDPAAARQEIAENKRLLEALIGAPLSLFAYPNGKPDRDFRGEHASIVRELGYAAAVTTAPGAAGYGADPYQLPRFTPWDVTPNAYLARLALTARQSYARAS